MPEAPCRSNRGSRSDFQLRQANLRLVRLVVQSLRDREGAAGRGHWQRIYALLDTLPAYVILLDPEYRVVFANRFYQERIGPADQPCYQTIKGRGDPCLDCQPAQVMADGIPRQCEAQLPDGRVFEVYAYPFLDQSGHRLALELGVDITARKEAEAQLEAAKTHLEDVVAARTDQLARANRELEASEQRVRQLIERVPAALFRARLSSGRLEEANPAMAEMLGYDSVEDLLQGFLARRAFTDSRALAFLTAELKRYGEVSDMEAQLRRKDGKLVWARFSARSHQGDDLIEGAAVDISEARHTAEALSESEARFRQLFEGSPTPIMELDCSRALAVLEELQARGVADLGAYLERRPDELLCLSRELKILNINQAGLDLLGAADQEELEAALAQGLVSGAPTGIQHMLQGLLEGREQISYATEMTTLGGDIRQVRVSLSAVRQGQATGLVVSLMDLTDRMRAEEALAREAAQNAALAGVAQTLITASSLGEISHQVLEAAESLTESSYGFVGYIDPDTGYLVCPTMSEGVWDHCRMEDKTAVFEGFHGLWGWGLEHRRSVLTNDAPGDPRSQGTPPGHLPIQRFLAVPALIKGELLGQVALANSPRDYTRDDLEVVERLATLYALAVRRRLDERELEAAKEAAEVGTRTKSAFLATMSHEIRTPMNAVLGLTQLVLAGDLDETQREHLVTVRSSARSLLGILDDILDFSKIEAGRLYLEETDLVMAEVVQAAVSTVDLSAREKGLALTWRIDQGVPEILVGDPTRLKQLILNLLSNAVKFTPEGSVSLGLEQVAGQDDRHHRLHLWVADTGVGIPLDKQEHVFQAFHQADASTTRRFGGTGLGLAICDQLARLMDGRIWLESNPGRGSTFHVLLSLKRAQPVPALEAPPPPPPEAKPAGRGLNILLAEDNPVNRKLATLLLTRKGHRVTPAEDGDTAVEMCLAGGFDLVLMDLQMPGRDGLEATRAIREAEAGLGRHTTIVAMTAHAMPDDREACLAAGMDGYLAKPLNIEEFYQTIAELTPSGGQEG